MRTCCLFFMQWSFNIHGRVQLTEYNPTSALYQVSQAPPPDLGWVELQESDRVVAVSAAGSARHFDDGL